MIKSNVNNFVEALLPFVIGMISLSLGILACNITPSIYLPVSDQVFKMAFNLDHLASVMLVVVALLGTIVLSYSARYLISDVTRTRFICQILATVIAVMFFVLADNLFTAFIAWQWIGFSLYLLLNHYHYQSEANRAAKKKFIVNRMGDMCFLLAIILCYQFYGTSEYHELAVITSKQLSIMNFTFSAHGLILMLVFVAIMTKSAQFPFHFWLPDTMQTPTPVSALMHAGVINAGGILLARLSSVFMQTMWVPYIILCVGIVSMLVGCFLKQIQADIKKKLAYSTMSQMGYMLMQSALGCFAAAVFHLIAHGFYKASLFLNAGNGLRIETRIKTGFCNPIKQSFQAVVLTLVMLWVANAMVQPTQISILILIFIAITLHQMIMSTLRDCQFSSSVLILTSFQVILVSYFGVLNTFESWLEIPRLRLINHNIEYSLGAIVIIGYAISLLLSGQRVRKIEWFSRSYFKLIKWMQVENHFRKYLLDPFRRLGDLLIQNLYNNAIKKLCFVGVSLLMIVFTGVEAYFYSKDLFLIKHALIIVCMIGLLMANRAKNLFDLFVLLSIAHLCLFAVDFAYIKIFNRGMILSFLMIFLGIGWLVSQAKGVNHKRQIVAENRLTSWGIYMAISLFLLIGIPGTASFIFWFNLISHAKTDLFMVLGLMMTNILLTIVALHTLQDYVFSLQDSHEIMNNKKLQAHIIFFGIVFTHIYFGIL